MATFVLYCIDKKDALELRMATRADHLAYLKGSSVTLHLGGPLLDETEKPIGSLLIIEADTESEAHDFSENDPYAKAGLFQSVEIKPYKFVAGDLFADQA